MAGIKKAEEEKKREETKPAVRVGSRVQFGSYPQSTKAPEPIMWRVLDITDGKALMAMSSTTVSSSITSTIVSVLSFWLRFKLNHLKVLT